MTLPANEQFIEAIAERVRSVFASEPAAAVDALAATLRVEPNAIRELVENRDGIIDVAFLIDVVAALVREFAVDPQWLLTGKYDPSTHRRALLLGEDRGLDGERAIRQYVREQYYKLVS